MTIPRQPDETTEAHPGLQPPVAPWINAFAGFATRVPARWSRTRRRRRLLFLALCAPGFVAIFATPLHHNFFLLVFGIVLFAAAALFRALTEPLVERVDASGPLVTSPSPPRSDDSSHA
ncbi:hypothetical protein [Phenylobacterium sp.]|uniref:hypothetical protein n=1 Tax=Phenylobacterium sp. TaxID=1871053 RepID=UPI0035645F01